MRRILLALPLGTLALAGCQSGNAGDLIPSIGTEIILRDVTIKLDEAQIRLLLTPAELQSLAQAVDSTGGGGGSGGSGGSQSRGGSRSGGSRGG